MGTIKWVRTHAEHFFQKRMPELTGEETQVRAGQVIYHYGTIPADELFHELAAASANGGITDLSALSAGQPQRNDGDGFELHRIGDAVSSRNVHSAVLDALRLCQNS